MKKRIQDVFLELIQNSKKSDRDIAKKLKISQPTVTRIRKRLEKNVIGAYTAIPVLPEIGIELISFIFGRCETPKKDIRECLEKMTKTSPRILFTASGEGMGKTCIIVGLHHNYRDYTDFLKTLREEVKIYCKGVKVEFDSFLAPTSKDHFLNFKNPVTHILKRKK